MRKLTEALTSAADARGAAAIVGSMDRQGSVAHVAVIRPVVGGAAAKRALRQGKGRAGRVWVVWPRGVEEAARWARLERAVRRKPGAAGLRAARAARLRAGALELAGWEAGSAAAAARGFLLACCGEQLAVGKPPTDIALVKLPVGVCRWGFQALPKRKGLQIPRTQSWHEYPCQSVYPMGCQRLKETATHRSKASD